MAMSKGKILITGISGFVASWAASEALEAGYTVVGTVRDKNSKKIEFLKEAMAGNPQKGFSANATGNLSLVEADLLSGDETWADVVSPGFDAVMHIASPYVTAKVKDESVLIKPAVEGTSSVLKACVKHRVKRVVLTSSFAAVADPLVEGKKYSSKDWSTPELQGAYAKSKTLAEKKAWKIVEGTNVQLTTLCPSGIRGPTLYTEKSMLSTFESGDFACRVLKGEYKFTHMCSGVIDVRDLGKAHLLAVTSPCAAGKRFILSGQARMYVEYMQMIAGMFPDYPVNVEPTPTWLVGLCRPDVKTIIGKSITLDTDESTAPGGLSTEGFKLEALEKTLKDMCDDVICMGAIDKSPAEGCACAIL